MFKIMDQNNGKIWEVKFKRGLLGETNYRNLDKFSF